MPTPNFDCFKPMNTLTVSLASVTSVVKRASISEAIDWYFELFSMESETPPME